MSMYMSMSAVRVTEETKKRYIRTVKQTLLLLNKNNTEEKKQNEYQEESDPGVSESMASNSTSTEMAHRSSSTCSTESTISLTSSMLTPGMIRSASVKAL